MVPYWRLGHLFQDRLLLVASHLFYGSLGYRILVLCCFQRSIEYIGGLGISAVRIDPTQRRNLGLLLSTRARLLTSGIDFRAIWAGVIVFVRVNRIEGRGLEQLQQVAPIPSGLTRAESRQPVRDPVVLIVRINARRIRAQECHENPERVGNAYLSAWRYRP